MEFSLEMDEYVNYESEKVFSFYYKQLLETPCGYDFSVEGEYTRGVLWLRSFSLSHELVPSVAPYDISEEQKLKLPTLSAYTENKRNNAMGRQGVIFHQSSFPFRFLLRIQKLLEHLSRMSILYRDEIMAL